MAPRKAKAPQDPLAVPVVPEWLIKPRPAFQTVKGGPGVSGVVDAAAPGSLPFLINVSAPVVNPLPDVDPAPAAARRGVRYHVEVCHGNLWELIAVYVPDTSVLLQRHPVGVRVVADLQDGKHTPLLYVTDPADLASQEPLTLALRKLVESFTL